MHIQTLGAVRNVRMVELKFTKVKPTYLLTEIHQCAGDLVWVTVTMVDPDILNLAATKQIFVTRKFLISRRLLRTILHRLELSQRQDLEAALQTARAAIVASDVTKEAIAKSHHVTPVIAQHTAFVANCIFN
jgi:hypothetical protein